MGNAWQKFRGWPKWAQITTWVVLVIVVLGALAPESEEEVDTTASPGTTQPNSEAAGESATTLTPTTNPPTTEPPTTTPPAPEWVEVATLSGSSEKQGDTFVLEGGKARLRYEFEAGQFGGFFAVYIVEEGDSLEESGGFPEVTCTQSCTDETLLRKPAGSYYLDVTEAASGTSSSKRNAKSLRCQPPLLEDRLSAPFDA